MERFQYYTAEDLREDLRTIVVTLTTPPFVIWVRVGRLRAKALIDSGVTGNFMNEEFARRIDCKKEALKEPYGLSNNNGRVTHHSGKVRLQMDGFKERRSFDITYLGGSDLVLGLS